jgi:hypothetical protein
MSQELRIGKYEFYPYEFDKNQTPTLEDLRKLLKKAKARRRKSILRKPGGSAKKTIEKPIPKD